MTTEKTFFKNNDVHITNARAVIGSRTYSLSNITSVGMFEKIPSRIPGLLVIVCGLIWMFVVGISVAAIIGLVVVLGGAFIVYSQKPEYIVRIGSASGEVNALTSPNVKYIQKIVDALNNAIVSRG